MSNLLRRFRAAWSMLQTFPAVALPTDYWTESDAVAWRNFMESDTGVKIRHMRWNRVYLSAQQAILESSDSRYKAGMAYGIRAMVAEEDALLPKPLSSSADEQQTQERDLGGAFRSVNR